MLFNRFSIFYSYISNTVKRICEYFYFFNSFFVFFIIFDSLILYDWNDNLEDFFNYEWNFWIDGRVVEIINYLFRSSIRYVFTQVNYCFFSFDLKCSFNCFVIDYCFLFKNLTLVIYLGVIICGYLWDFPQRKKNE